MKSYKVKKGKHDFWPPSLGIYWRKNSLKYIIKFDPSCEYDLGNEDQFDTNKLFGLGFFSGLKSISHTDSVRFGWSYDKIHKKIRINSYCYLNGIRRLDYYNPICFCELNKEYEFFIGISLNNYHLIVWEKDDVLSLGSESISHNNSKKVSFLLSPWFGGNQSSPHDIIIYMEKE